MARERVSNSSFSHKPSIPLWTSSDVQKATQGEALASFEATSVVIDSRGIRGGELFVALKGPQFDGHDYVKMALEAGAAGALVSHIPEGVAPDAPLVVVPDVLQALNDLAAFARQRSTAQIIGVTGSFGKTSLKEALRHVLEQGAYTLATERSFNNHWGLPLTLARLHPEHKYAVIEMGMNNPGEISSHTKLTQPHVALITNTGNAHIGKMGTVEEIAKAKAEIFEGLVENGKAILWREDDAFETHQAQLKEQGIPCVTFGSAADFSADSEITPAGLRVTVTSGFCAAQSLVLSTFSEHWARNCAAIAAVLDAVGVDWAVALKALENFDFPRGRGNILTTDAGLTIVDESYNAAPTTMEYALKSLAEIGKATEKRTIAILGDMLELGPESPAYHRQLSMAPGFEAVSKIYCCGEDMKHLYDVLTDTQRGAWAKDHQELIPLVLSNAEAGDIYLVKGSRGQWAERGRMAAFVDALQNHTLELQKNKVR